MWHSSILYHVLEEELGLIVRGNIGWTDFGNGGSIGLLEKCWNIQQKRNDSRSNLRRQARDEAQIDQLRREEHEVSLGASINIMPESMLDELSLADPKHANIIVEMADKTRCVSQGIVENVLVKIDKFSFTSDFVIIYTKELNSKTIILGRPFLANIHAEINISIREASLGIKEDRVKIKMKEQECNTAVGEHLNKQLTSQYELSHGAINKTYWCDLFADNKLRGQIQEKILTKEQEDPKKCEETKERAIIGAMVKNLLEEWFLEVSRDKDDLEGIIDYLEPILYDGFIDHNDESYKQRRNTIQKLRGNSRDRLDSYSFGNLAEFAAVTP
ncbi:reverse transcriptase domain-containing protein [Tanacetum coccineum]